MASARNANPLRIVVPGLLDWRRSLLLLHADAQNTGRLTAFRAYSFATDIDEHAPLFLEWGATVQLLEPPGQRGTTHLFFFSSGWAYFGSSSVSRMFRDLMHLFTAQCHSLIASPPRSGVRCAICLSTSAGRSKPSPIHLPSRSAGGAIFSWARRKRQPVWRTLHPVEKQHRIFPAPVPTSVPRSLCRWRHCAAHTVTNRAHLTPFYTLPGLAWASGH